MGGQQRKAPQHVGQHILQRQRNGQGQHTGQSHKAGDVDAQACRQAQSQKQVQPDFCQRQNQPIGRLFQPGFFQGSFQQPQNRLDQQNAHHQGQHRSDGVV